MSLRPPWLAELILRSIIAGRSDPLDLECACHELWSTLGDSRRYETSAPRWLASTAELLAEDSATLTIGEVAAFANVDPAHYVRTFRRFYGCPPAEWRRLIRLRRAAAELSSGRAPLVDIAIDLGFADQSHFTKVFRRWTGVSPGRYRRLTS